MKNAARICQAKVNSILKKKVYDLLLLVITINIYSNLLIFLLK